MILDDFKSAWQDQQQQASKVDLAAVTKRVRRRTTSFQRRVLVRDILEFAAIVYVVPVFVSYIRIFDSWVAKAGAAIVVIGAIQVAVVLLLTRFRRRPRSDRSLAEFTKDELRRVELQHWLLTHVACWYVGPMMMGCCVFALGVFSGAGLVARLLFFVAFSSLLIGLNRLWARWRVVPLRDELIETLRSLDEEIEVTKPQFLGFEKMRIYNLYAIGALLFACLILSAVQMLPAGELTRDEARLFANALVESERADGISVGIIDGDREMTFHFGMAKDGQVPDDKTIYEIGSVSKVFTGLLLADSAIKENGLLAKSPEAVDGVALPAFNGTKITWQQLSTHRSGLPRLPDNMGNDNVNPYAKYDSTLAKEFLSGHKLRRKPGEKNEYSNFAVSYLGYLLSKRAGMTYEELLTSRITKPLGMTDTVITISPDRAKRFATAHSSFGKECSSWEFADLPGAGGIRSTTSDMMKFMKAQLNSPGDETGKAIDLAWKQHHKAERSGFAMGLGWHIARDGQTRWHNGQTGGFHSAVFVNRKLNVGVVVLANTAIGEVDQIAELLVQRVAGQKVKPPTYNKEVKIDMATMKRLEGRYQLAPTFIFDVSVVDGKLMVGVTNQPTHQVYAKSPTKWFYKVVDAELEFDLGATGPAKSVVLHQNGAKQKAQRTK